MYLLHLFQINQQFVTNQPTNKGRKHVADFFNLLQIIWMICCPGSGKKMCECSHVYVSHIYESQKKVSDEFAASIWIPRLLQHSFPYM